MACSFLCQTGSPRLESNKNDKRFARHENDPANSLRHAAHGAVPGHHSRASSRTVDARAGYPVYHPAAGFARSGRMGQRVLPRQREASAAHGLDRRADGIRHGTCRLAVLSAEPAVRDGRDGLHLLPGARVFRAGGIRVCGPDAGIHLFLQRHDAGVQREPAASAALAGGGAVLRPLVQT